MNDESTLIGRTLADRYRVESEIARGRDGERLPCPRPPSRSRRCHEGPRVAVRRRPALHRPLPRRGSRSGLALASEPRARVRLGQRRPSALHRHGAARPPPDPSRPAGQRGSALGRRGAPHRSRAPRGSAGGPRARPRALRREAGQRHARTRSGQAHRLRDRDPAARRDRWRHEHRLTALHVARAAARPGAHAGQRPVQPRRRPLRVAHRAASVSGRDARGGQRRPGRRTRQAAIDDRRRHPRPAGRGDPPGAAPRSGRALRERRGDGGVPRCIGRRDRGASRRRHDPDGPRSAAHSGLRPRTGGLCPTRRAAAALAGAGPASRHSGTAPRRERMGPDRHAARARGRGAGGRARRVPAPRARPRGRGSRGHLHRPAHGRARSEHGRRAGPRRHGDGRGARGRAGIRARAGPCTATRTRSRPAGIIDQEPRAGRQVAPGSTFSLYSARFADCQ